MISSTPASQIVLCKCAEMLPPQYLAKPGESWWPTPSLPEMCKSIGIATETRKYGETVAVWFPIKQCVVFFV
jgi:hypothetical protein